MKKKKREGYYVQLCDLKMIRSSTKPTANGFYYNVALHFMDLRKKKLLIFGFSSCFFSVA